MESSILEDELNEDKAKQNYHKKFYLQYLNETSYYKDIQKQKIYQIGIEYTYPIHKLVYNLHNLNT